MFNTSFFNRFDSSSPGLCYFKATPDGEEQCVRMLKKMETLPPGAPPPLAPPGLSLQRQEYLHRQIRPYVAEAWKDVVCPEPRKRTGDVDSDDE